MDLLTNPNQSYVCPCTPVTHAHNICTSGSMGTLGETTVRSGAHGKLPGETQRLEAQETNSRMQRRSDTQPGHKRAERSAQPRGWGPPGAHVRSPPTPQPRTRGPTRRHKTDPKLGRRDLRAAKREPSRRLSSAPASASHRSRRFGGSSKGARQPAPQSP